MVGSHENPSPPPDALRAEIALLRGAVAALRAARRSAVDDVKRETRATTRKITASSVVAFALGVAITASLVALYRVGFCP